MAFSLVVEAPLAFTSTGIKKDCGTIVKSDHVSVENLGKVCGPNESSSVSDKLLSKLKKLVSAQPTSNLAEWQRDYILEVKLSYGVLHPGSPRTKTGQVSITDRNPSSGLLGRLGRVCGGLQNLKANIDLEFGTKDDKMELMFKDLKLYLKDRTEGTLAYGTFNFTQSLADKWKTKARFGGKLTFILKLNDDAYNRIYLDGLSNANFVNRRLLEDAWLTGDMSIMSASGSWIPCHKTFIIGCSNVMRKVSPNQVEMRDMSEHGIRALLAFLYCRDIRTAMARSDIAVELLIASDKYGITELYETMKEVVLVKKDEWFSVAVALQLVAFGKSKVDDPGFKEIETKAVSVIQSMSLDELRQHAVFRQLFHHPESAMQMWDYFRKQK